jgi:serine/threonine-protein kinase
MNHLLNIPNYTLIREIGEGGMGTVYLGIDNMLQRHVAVKALKPGISLREENMQRFQSEAVTLAKLRHPNITVLYNLIRNGENWCMIMEYVDGETLESLLKKRATLTVKEALYVIIQTLEGLQHAHGKGVVHRDLKPSNLMLSTEGEVKIMDFGIARIAGHSRLTRVGQAVGTPQYMSPEQVKGQEGNAASDIYSLGIVLYELLTGVTPFTDGSEFEIMQAHTNRKPVPPATLNPAIPDELNRAILKAIAKNPSQRFADADEFKQCLKQIVASETDTASRSAMTNLFSWLRWKPAMTKIGTLWSLPLKIDRQYLTGAGLLAVSLLVAVLVLFYNSSDLKPSTGPESLAETGDDQQTPVIEVETETPLQKPPATTQPFATRVLPVDEPVKSPVTLPGKEPSEKKKKPDRKKEPEKSKTQEQPPAEPSPVDSAKAVAKIQPEETQPQPETVHPEPPAAMKLNKQVVISRGTPVDVVLDQSYDYDSATDKTRVTLSVAETLVVSGVTVIPAGAKAYALLHKHSRPRELELEILEVESITGQKLKSMKATSNGVSFPQGKRFKIHLEYNRLGR